MGESVRALYVFISVNICCGIMALHEAQHRAIILQPTNQPSEDGEQIADYYEATSSKDNFQCTQLKLEMSLADMLSASSVRGIASVFGN